MLDAWMRAANYVSVGQSYLRANPLLREPLTLDQVKPRLLGHWGTTPGLNFVYAHMNRAIRARDLSAIFIAGPGHGGPGLVANTADGRVMEVLSEHLCQGWLEGFLLTGRHGLFSCYEAFTHIIDSMFNQHTKWLDTTRHIPSRAPIASLNYLLTPHVWRQDHSGNSHQDPGFIDHVVNKKADVVRVYLPPDADTLLSVTDHCLGNRNNVNVIVAGKQPSPQWLSMDAAAAHCEVGLGVWNWASTDDDRDPDVVLACAGDVPTLEALAATALLLTYLPALRARFVNVFDLMTLQAQVEHPRELSDTAFDAIFTTDRPILFAYHGYPWLINRLTYPRTNHGNLHVWATRKRNDYDPVRHDGAQRSGPIPSGARRHPPCPRARAVGRETASNALVRGETR